MIDPGREDHPLPRVVAWTRSWLLGRIWRGLGGVQDQPPGQVVGLISMTNRPYIVSSFPPPAHRPRLGQGVRLGVLDQVGQAGIVASAVRMIAKAALTGNLSRILERLSDRAEHVIAGQLTAEQSDGIGWDTIMLKTWGVPGVPAWSRSWLLSQSGGVSGWSGRPGDP
jgi:hypothetical protein